MGTSLVLTASFWILTCLCISCRSIPTLPPVDLSSPGWRLQQGQAVWKPTKNRPELTGEILLATRSSGEFFVQFSKTPFTLATAQLMNGQWQIAFGSGDQSWNGRGEPPSRFAWFQLRPALAGTPLSRDWQFEHVGTNAWRLENRRTGESLQGAFFP